MQTIHNRTKQAALVAAFFSTCGLAHAQTAAGVAPAAPAAAQQTSAGHQQGVIYPGQPIVQSAPVATTTTTTTALPPATQAAGVPTLPPLPGYTQPISPAYQAVEDTMPTDAPQAMMELRRRLDAFQKAGADAVKAAPVAVARSVDLTQAPGETPPIVRIAMGMPTNVVFMDATGAPWPIAYVTPGAPSQFDTLIPEAGTSSVQLRPKNPHAYGGFTVKLVDNPIPVSIIVTAAQKEFDVRLDTHMNKRGPNAKVATSLGGSGNAQVDPVLSTFLDGVPPAGARERRTSMRGVAAWSYQGNLYVRTNVQLAAPNWYASKESGDVRAYALPDVSSLTVTVDGQMTVVNLSE